MRIRPILVSLMLSALLAVAGVQAGSLRAGERGAMEGAVHPDVGETAQTCDGCHAEVTPEIHRAWYASAHGVNNVKCFVCHGSLTERFAVQASTDRCAACHAGQIPSMEAFSRFIGKEGSSCFACHPPHWLSPHALLPKESPEPAPDQENGGSR